MPRNHCVSADGYVQSQWPETEIGNSRLKEERHVSDTAGITLGNAAYALRHFSLREFFETSKEMGLPAVEVHYDWLVGEASNAIPVDYTAQDVEDVKRLAAETGVTVATLAGRAVVELGRGDSDTADPRNQKGDRPSGRPGRSRDSRLRRARLHPFATLRSARGKGYRETHTIPSVPPLTK